MKVTVGSTPTKMANKDRYLRRDLGIKKKRFKIAFISVLIVLILSLSLNLLQYFHKI